MKRVALRIIEALVLATVLLVAIAPERSLEAAVTLINLTKQVSGILPSANGGTANAFFTVSGPTSSAKTFTFPDASSTIPVTICSGTIALPTSAMTTGTKYGASSSTPLTTTCTGLATTDNIKLDFNADPTGITGYAPSASGMLTIIVYPTTNTINLYLYNNTGSSITPGAATVNYHVWR